MQSVNNSYLFSIINRVIRHACQRDVNENNMHSATGHVKSAVIMRFIKSNPFLDAGVKDFMLNESEENNIIISNAWEIAFIKNCTTWASQSEGHNDNHFYLHDQHTQGNFDATVLKLPY